MKMKNLFFALVVLAIASCGLPSKPEGKTIIPLLLHGGTETIDNSQSGLPSLAAGFWAGISNNVFTVGNINTGFSKQFNSIGMVNSAVLSSDCSKVYLAETGGTYVYDLFHGTHTYLHSNVGNMASSPDGSVIAFMSGTNLWYIYTGTNQVVKIHTFANGSNNLSWKDSSTLLISFQEGSTSSWHIYSVDINTWATSRLTLTDNLNAEYEYAVNDSDGIQYYIGDSGSGTSNNFWKSTNWSVFQSIPLNVARNLVKDQNGQVYVAQGVINGSTEMRMVNGAMIPQENMPIANNTIYDFCKLKPNILNN